MVLDGCVSDDRVVQYWFDVKEENITLFVKYITWTTSMQFPYAYFDSKQGNEKILNQQLDWNVYCSLDFDQHI